MRAKEVMELSPIVPVVALENAEDALPLAEALLEGGISIMEITLRTEAGLKAIEAISHSIPQMHVGAGTVLNRDDFREAVAHGAEFIFSPGISEELMEASKETGVALIPGVATASEVMLAKNNGFEYCKLFPANLAGGVEVLKAFSGPFPSISFCPTGGVNLNNVNEFLSLPNVLCVGGSWIVPKALIEKKDFHGITRLCKEVIHLIS
ncbi:bifunctional 4-hydroxy-2-oxoglutarate aldolase/2-dehydro-3-deoxy-phosphogluconate aldolase [Sulfurovum mangrovi]|uniref:bifunctional 4-hydroxy-2-oxoglutarate aldolase/2-dehydro-3-deoxy-phosphogluconate aldolase n=1 Tax=Sulfurovum mangrovi TaxID=2893889 RepID=UPI001E5038F5|nr:bifunctional 4-hydroxy-2-oxoglutarate aldolase/2-dehydro-3-deoxy-phosphogluconate aldolase [Sulfurovum mangrovi]UFH58447.1 bifunctional 4-hydroxy-2-oxoglutarate aldolase/2-dehydro-3-deoxy-phosphogluconate aldolase [Sulfurovum mangrovi]